ncbi:MAG: flavin reductase family protein [Bryobacterales bacterium]|nr:flavin reductase family protein [Bryobacterales bacterium]
MVIPQSFDTFRRACSLFATGVTVATVRAIDGTPHGLTVNSFTSVSLDPPLILICIDHDASVISCFLESSHFAVNVLGQEQRELSMRFATRGMDRFDGIAWTPGVSGAPLIPEALAHFECRKTNTIEAGDHTIFIGQVEEMGVREGRPLLFFASSYAALK